jgi:hypothetical protein
MVVNDYACLPAIRGALEFIASQLAPAVLNLAIDAGIADANAGQLISLTTIKAKIEIIRALKSGI